MIDEERYKEQVKECGAMAKEFLDNQADWEDYPMAFRRGWATAMKFMMMLLKNGDYTAYTNTGLQKVLVMMCDEWMRISEHD